MLRLDPFLKGDPFIQVDHIRIENQTAAIVGQMEDPWAKAEAIYEWVYANIVKIPVLSFPSALDVLESFCSGRLSGTEERC